MASSSPEQKTQRSSALTKRSPSTPPGPALDRHVGPMLVKLPENPKILPPEPSQPASFKGKDQLSQNFPASNGFVANQAPSATMVRLSSPAQVAASPAGGIVDVNRRTGAIAEAIVSVLAFILFLSLWIYLLVAGCYRDTMGVLLLKLFSILGAIVSLFTLFHSCFERRSTIGRGVLGCIIFFIINIVIFVNIIGAFMAVNCACVCKSTMNAFQADTKKDLVIFIMELLSSGCLVAVLVISAVVHK